MGKKKWKAQIKMQWTLWRMGIHSKFTGEEYHVTPDLNFYEIDIKTGLVYRDD